MPLWRGPQAVTLAPRDLPLVPRALPQDDWPLRIVALGTSLSARGPWPDRLAARLAECLGHRVEIARVARPGANVTWGGAPETIAAVAGHGPDVVLLEFAINDADLRDGLRRAEADAQTVALLDALAEAAPQAAFVELTMNPASGARALHRPGLEARYADVVARAEARGDALVDLYHRWIALPRAARGLDDGLHPAAEIAAAVIVPPLAAHLAAGFGGTCPEA